jgi:hypothetical protein
MNNSIAGAAVAGLVGAVVAIVVVASGLVNVGSPGARNLADATIFIDPRGAGCIITTIPRSLPVSKHGKVKWEVLNRCDAAADSDVEIKFKADDPLDPKCNRKNKTMIQCDVNPKKDYGIYRYSVIAGAYSEDPDLEIAP